MSEAKKKVRKACKIMHTENLVPTETFVVLTSDSKRISLDIGFKWGTQLTEEEMSNVFNLFEQNMREYYGKSSWGYHPGQKLRELQDSASRYILAKHDNIIYAFVHYRFVVENNQAVIYCYEIQVEKTCVQRGLGTELLGIAEKLGKIANMEKIMATVFAFNGASLAFFHKAGFREDAISPGLEEKADYFILSKRL